MNTIKPSHEPQLKQVTENGHTYSVNGDICVNCQQLLDDKECKPSQDKTVEKI